ncbi:hypothetical protein GQ43DRAFT_445316 [Delitschia confertaspora ATCC 74209]|uniref:Lysine-specific metallo-endopeptidase domain-containing protein n=1 Tax=Delitschia confertaspora ATCC 74209 TaxID=1513339 RepID=A0A9P4MMR7_9PLEO|nr:hypothetical protein GQ43DRAFT_445316 [Delitschia confertaspora ATCC 74209]
MQLHAPLAVAFSLPFLTTAAKTYYVDNSCTEKPGWSTYITETMTMAKRTSERLESKTDTDFEAVFKRLFQTGKSGDDYNYVKKTMDDIASWTSTTSLKESDIRIFCDQDKRWEEKKVKGVIKGWFDPINNMVSQIQPSCLKEGINGRTYSRLAKGDHKDHNKNRVAISICDVTFDPTQIIEVPLHIEDAVEKGDITEDGEFKFLSVLVSHTILHEMAHAADKDIKDLPDKETAYGWEEVIKKDSREASRNADNYAFLGLAAILADKGYSLPRINPNDPEDVRKEAEKKAEEGSLTFLIDHTKRALGMLTRAFRG